MAATAPSTSGPGGVDWQAVERSPEFRELVRRRKAFLIPVTVVWLTVFFAYLLLAALAPGFMGNEVALGFTVGFVLSAIQVFLTWGVTWAYLRRANRVFEPLERRAAQVAAEKARAGGAAR
jgi:uncharacterized membrane protein (DUF485 family)